MAACWIDGVLPPEARPWLHDAPDAPFVVVTAGRNAEGAWQSGWAARLLCGKFPATEEAAPQLRVVFSQVWAGIRGIAPSAPGIPVMVVPKTETAPTTKVGRRKRQKVRALVW